MNQNKQQYILRLFRHIGNHKKTYTEAAFDKNGNTSFGANVIACEQHHIKRLSPWKSMHLQFVCSNAPAFINGVSMQLFRTDLCLPSQRIGTYRTTTYLYLRPYKIYTG